MLAKTNYLLEIIEMHPTEEVCLVFHRIYPSEQTGTAISMYHGCIVACAHERGAKSQQVPLISNIFSTWHGPTAGVKRTGAAASASPEQG